MDHVMCIFPNFIVDLLSLSLLQHALWEGMQSIVGHHFKIFGRLLRKCQNVFVIERIIIMNSMKR